MKKFTIEIDDATHNRLMEKWHEINDPMEDKQTFEEFLYSRLHEEVLTPEEKEQENREILDIVHKNPGITERQLFDILAKRHAHEFT